MATSIALDNSGPTLQFRQIYEDVPETIVIPRHLQHQRIEGTVALFGEDRLSAPIRKRKPPAQLAGRVKELGVRSIRFPPKIGVAD